MAALIQGNPIEWMRVPGHAQQIETSMEHLWVLTVESQIQHCRLPCPDLSGWTLSSDAYYKSLSVNPFDIWTVDNQNQVFRCRFPCLKGSQFHKVAEGFKRISLGLSEAWGVTSDNRVAKAEFEFAKEMAPIDHTKLNWNFVGDSIKQVSIGEDGEVWGIRAGAGAQQIVRYLASQNRWIDVPGVAKRVSVGADYIYGITGAKKVMRCLRPCRNGGWEQPSEKEVKEISARFSNPGVVMAVSASDDENAILIGNSAWSAKFHALDSSMPFQHCNNTSKDKGAILGAFSQYFIPDWHLQLSQQTPVSAAPF